MMDKNTQDHLLRFFTYANTLCSMIKKHRSAAVAIFAQLESSLPFVLTRVVIVPVLITPKKDPMTLPTPPVRSVPPITEDAMASISNPEACCTEPDIVFRQ